MLLGPGPGSRLLFALTFTLAGCFGLVDREAPECHYSIGALQPDQPYPGMKVANLTEGFMDDNADLGAIFHRLDGDQGFGGPAGSCADGVAAFDEIEGLGGTVRSYPGEWGRDAFVSYRNVTYHLTLGVLVS